MSEKSVFQRIIDREIPADVLYEDDRCMAFRDIAPQAPVHFLVIPRKPVRSLDDLDDEDGDLMGHLLLVIRNLGRELELDNGYRVISNCGAQAGQTVDHLHFHVLAGKTMGWP